MKKILLFILCTQTFLVAQNLVVPQAGQKPIIDGEMDLVWRNTTEHKLTVYKPITESQDDWLDLSGSFRVMQNNQDMFLFIEIIDNEIDLTGPEIEQDNVHLEINWHGRQFNFGPILAKENSSKNRKFIKTEFGYTLELKLEFENSTSPPHPESHFILIVTDADNQDNTADTKLTFTLDPKSKIDYTNFRIYEELLVEEATFIPEIDGIMEIDWQNIFRYNQNLFVSEGVSETFSEMNDWQDNYFNFRMMWDESYLYLFYKGYDDVLNTSNKDSYNNDGAEIYFDGNNSKRTKYDSDDSQTRIEINGNITGTKLKAPAQYAFTETDEGWNMEMAFELDDLKITPEPDYTFGFDIQKNDNDDGQRSSIAKWWADGHEGWRNASVVGTAKLYNGQSAIVEKTIQPQTFKLYDNFPNPFNPSTAIEYDLTFNANVKITIYNTNGQLIRTLVNANKTNGSYRVIWNGLNEYGMAVSAGVYFYHMEAKNLTEHYQETKRMLYLK